MNENKVLILNGIVVGAVIIAAILWTTGCIHLLGGRSQTIVNIHTKDTGSDQAMEADSDTSDILNNLLQNAKIPISQIIPGSGQGGPVVDPPSGDAPPDSSPGNGSADPPDDPVPPTGSDAFLWKPKAEKSPHFLVVLTPASLQGATLTVNGERLSGPTRNGLNGNREHWRAGKAGSAFSAPASVAMTAKDGRVYRWTVPDTSVRHNGGKPAPEGVVSEPETPDPEPQPGDPTMVIYTPPHVILPNAIDPVRVALMPHGNSAVARTVPVSGGIFAVPTEWQSLPSLLAQVHTDTKEALYEITFDPREPWSEPFTVVYTPGWQVWTAAIPQAGYQMTAEQATNRQSTKWRYGG